MRPRKSSSCPIQLQPHEGRSHTGSPRKCSAGLSARKAHDASPSNRTSKSARTHCTASPRPTATALQHSLANVPALHILTPARSQVSTSCYSGTHCAATHTHTQLHAIAVRTTNHHHVGLQERPVRTCPFPVAISTHPELRGLGCTAVQAQPLPKASIRVTAVLVHFASKAHASDRFALVMGRSSALLAAVPAWARSDQAS